MATSNDRMRARYGICLSDSCPKCKDKTIQIITGRKDFVCEECGKPLREVPRPRTPWEKHGKKIIGGVVAAALIGGGATFFALSGSKTPKPKPTPVNIEPKSPDTTQVASPQTPEPPAPEPAVDPKPADPKPADPKPVDPMPAGPKVGNGTINLGYGTYKGESKNGKPHGHGVITYKSSHKIVASKDFVANPGDRFEGEFRDGAVSGGIGYWYHDGDITAIKP